MAVFHRRQPDYYGDFMPSLDFIIDPEYLRNRVPQDGQLHRDAWGTIWCFKPGTPGQHPVVTKETAVIRDIEHWEDQLRVPNLKDLDWSEAEACAKQVDRKEKFCAIFSSGGLFERSHHLMGMEQALINYMLYPDEMARLLRVLADYKIEYLQLAAEHLQPDIVFFHDDWGNKLNVFLPPELWRRLIRPLHTEIIRTAHECGMIFMHHADCVCEPLVTDMVEMGVDIWQGPFPERHRGDPAHHRRKAPMIAVSTDENRYQKLRRKRSAEVRRAFDTYCPAGRFFPSIANGCCFRKWNNDIYLDELASYGRKYALEHPIPSVPVLSV
jgi:hypothetical protein